MNKYEFLKGLRNKTAELILSRIVSQHQTRIDGDTMQYQAILKNGRVLSVSITVNDEIDAVGTLRYEIVVKKHHESYNHSYVLRLLMDVNGRVLGRHETIEH